MKLAALKELLERATPGPWRVNRTHDLWVEIYKGRGLEQRMIADCLREGDAHVIVALYGYAKALIECAEALHEYFAASDNCVRPSDGNDMRAMLRYGHATERARAALAKLEQA